MKRFVGFCGKIKYLGLFGLPGLFFDIKPLKVLMLFWLFGFVPIFYNFSIFIQAMKQILGMLITPVRHGFHLPNVENYQCKVQYSLPFKEEWTVVNGGIDKEHSHSWPFHSQRYAYDFIILDEEGQSYNGEETELTSYYCYGKEILAPADGEVIEAQGQHPDSIILGGGQAECTAKDIRGNYILIRHADNEYSLLAHLAPGSIRVKPGDHVKRGQCIALCGNSGNSSEPHLHFQLQNGKNFFISAGLPIEFTNVISQPAPNYSKIDPRPVTLFSKELGKKFIMRSLRVYNG